MTTNTKASTKLSAHKLSAETCVNYISNGLVMGRQALLLELSVCVSIFAGAGSISRETKQLVADVYKQAGYDAENKQSRHYKTVNRRVNASAALYSKLGAKKVAEWVGTREEDELLQAVATGLEEHKFESMDDVLEFAGRPSNRNASKAKGASKKPAKVKAEKPAIPMQVFRVPHVKVELPEDMSSEAMLKLAAKIIDAARKKEQTELRTAAGHLGDVKAPMVVSTMH